MPHQGGATQKIPLSAGYRNCRSTPPTSPWPPGGQAPWRRPIARPPVAHPAFQSCVNTFASTPSSSPASPRPSQAQRSLRPTLTSPRARNHRSHLLIFATQSRDSFLSVLPPTALRCRAKAPLGDRPPLGLSGNFSLLVATTKRQLDCALHHTTGSLCDVATSMPTKWGRSWHFPALRRRASTTAQATCRVR